MMESNTETVHFERSESNTQAVAYEVTALPSVVKEIFGIEEVERRTCPVDSRIEPGWTWIEWIQGWRKVRNGQRDFDNSENGAYPHE